MSRPRALLLALFLVAFAVAAQMPAPAASPPPVDVVETAPGEAAVLVPLPERATAEEARAVGVSSADTLEQVASGEVTIAEATRDPGQAPDPGSGGLFWLLAVVFGGIIRPVTDALVERVKGLDNRLAGAINTAVLLGTYVGAWALLHGTNPSLPQDPASWVIAAFASAGAGSATSSGMRTAKKGEAP